MNIFFLLYNGWRPQKVSRFLMKTCLFYTTHVAFEQCSCERTPANLGFCCGNTLSLNSRDLISPKCTPNKNIKELDTPI